MSTVRVSVIGALAGEELLSARAFDCACCVRHVRAALGHRPSRPVKLFLHAVQVEDDFVPTAGETLQLSVVISDAITEEERGSLLQQVREARIGDVYDVFRDFSDAAKDDAAVVLAVMRKNCASLRYAGEACRDDNKIVLEAVRKHGASLQYAGKACRDDKEIVLRLCRRLCWRLFAIRWQNVSRQ